jgi:hypothetical protein
VGWKRQQRKLGFDDYPQRAFAADEPVDRIVSEGVPDGVLLEMRAPKGFQVAIRKHDFDALNVVPGRAVFESACARRIARDGAANGGFFLTRRVWREQQARGGGGALDYTHKRSRSHGDRFRIRVEADSRDGPQ